MISFNEIGLFWNELYGQFKWNRIFLKIKSMISLDEIGLFWNKVYDGV